MSLNIRAVRVELVEDMSTHSFILALIRFTNIYGILSLTFTGIIPILFTLNEFNEHFQVYNIKHVRIPLYAAWVGSTWERMIRIMKSCLYETIGRSRVNYFDLHTMISDIQNAINSRLLMYRCSSDLNLEIITPNCFRPNVDVGLVLKIDDQDVWKAKPLSTGARHYFSDTLIFDFPSTIEWQNSFNRIA